MTQSHPMRLAHLMRLLPAALLSFLAFTGVAHAEWYKRTDAIMGTRIYVELWDTDAAHGEASIDAVMADMRRIDELMSHYKPESQLSKINQHAADAPVVVDKELFDLIKLSTHIAARRRAGRPPAHPDGRRRWCE